MQLKKDFLLQGGKYRIEEVLGQGGFGITYLGTQVALNRKVAIKEFFMKEYCEREDSTSHVSLGTSGSREMVERFRLKFIKEAQTIAALHHPNVISIYDIFEENGTAYYVMEYLCNGSLTDMVKSRGHLDESDALVYIRQVAEALKYIHERNMNHLDVKPGNVLLDEDGHAVLIDFGLSKRYDEEGNQTSTTPVGISHGYAPLEQYKKGGVGTFSPATDVYSLGATFYKLLTGQTPPEASDVNDDGLPPLPAGISKQTVSAIVAAMQPSRRNRPQSVNEFLEMLERDVVVPPILNNDEETCLTGTEQVKSEKVNEQSKNQYVEHSVSSPVVSSAAPTVSSKKSKNGIIIGAVAVGIAVVVFLLFGMRSCNDGNGTSLEDAAGIDAIDTIASDSVGQEELRRQETAAKAEQEEQKKREETVRKEQERKRREAAAKEEQERKRREETARKEQEQMTEQIASQMVEMEDVVEAEKEEEIFQVVEEMPEFPGGLQELMSFLSNNIKYPSIAQENGVQGRVIVGFVVDTDGSIVNPTVVRSVDPYLDAEALRVVKAMPKWKPGKQRGKAVRVKYTLPMMFRLQ